MLANASQPRSVRLCRPSPRARYGERAGWRMLGNKQHPSTTTLSFHTPSSTKGCLGIPSASGVEDYQKKYSARYTALVGVGASACLRQRCRRANNCDEAAPASCGLRLLSGAVLASADIVGILWCTLSPPPFSHPCDRMRTPPREPTYPHACARSLPPSPPIVSRSPTAPHPWHSVCWPSGLPRGSTTRVAPSTSATVMCVPLSSACTRCFLPPRSPVGAHGDGGGGGDVFQREVDRRGASCDPHSERPQADTRSALTADEMAPARRPLACSTLLET